MNVMNKNMLLIRKEDKLQYVFIQDFNTFMYNHTFHCGTKYFCCYYLHPQVKDCFKISCKHLFVNAKKDAYVRFENCERNINHHL